MEERKIKVGTTGYKVGKECTWAAIKDLGHGSVKCLASSVARYFVEFINDSSETQVLS